MRNETREKERTEEKSKKKKKKRTRQRILSDASTHEEKKTMEFITVSKTNKQTSKRASRSFECHSLSDCCRRHSGVRVRSRAPLVAIVDARAVDAHAAVVRRLVMAAGAVLGRFRWIVLVLVGAAAQHVAHRARRRRAVPLQRLHGKPTVLPSRTVLFRQVWIVLAHRLRLENVQRGIQAFQFRLQEDKRRACRRMEVRLARTRISSGSMSRMFSSPNSMSPFACSLATMSPGSTPSGNDRNRSRPAYSSVDLRSMKHN